LHPINIYRENPKSNQWGITLSDGFLWVFSKHNRRVVFYFNKNFRSY
jgi:hypothetical protein